MDYQVLINQEIVNAKGETGIVISIDEEDITVQYLDETKTYKRYIALKNQFLTFKDEKLQQIALKMQENDAEAMQKEEEKKAEAERIYKLKRQRANELYSRLAYKNYAFQKLFGREFKYPLFERFMKQFKSFIIYQDFSSFSLMNLVSSYHWYYYI